MPLFRKPSPRAIETFLDNQRNADLSYAAVGATVETPPNGYNVDHTRVRLGSGRRAFDAACAAITRWEQFRLGWVEPWTGETPIQKGEVVAVLARSAGLWWLNACRIVYVIDERESRRRFGFAYGTLAAHAESGEERFLVEWDAADDGVWYDIFAFSRPRHPLARLGYPFARRLQRRFARDSAAAMRRAVGGG
ncbi:MAG: DUF1990 domain-containing protein [Pirellulaceae bacterium]